MSNKYKIIVNLNVKAWHGYSTESIWALKEGNYYRIDNIPFYANGISYGDLISVRSIDENMIFDRTIENSGHSTYRIFSLTKEEENFQFFWKLLERLGCSYEQVSANLYAIDVPANTDIYEVFKILELGEKREIWDFEEGHCGHALKESTT